MNAAARSLLLVSVLVSGACESMGGDAMSMPNIDQMLAGVVDKPSAEAAQGPLDSAVAKLQEALAGAQGDGEGAAAAGGSMVDQVLGNFGISGETLGMIQQLLANPEIAAVLGGTLGKLKELIPAG